MTSTTGSERGNGSDREQASIASSLIELATTLSSQADEVAVAVRETAEFARRTASHAAQLKMIGERLTDHLREQQRSAEGAHAAAQEGEVAISALADGAIDIESMSALIAKIAQESRLLAFNARIEAARSGEAGRGFDVVANAMGTLSSQSMEASRSIDARAQGLVGRIDTARRLFDAGRDQARALHLGIDAIRCDADTHAEATGSIAALTDRTAELVERSTAAIGRITSSATTIRVLAQQIGR